MSILKSSVSKAYLAVDRDLEREFQVISLYITGAGSSVAAASLYKNAMSKMSLDWQPYEIKVWECCLHFPYLFRWGDVGMALVSPHSAFRSNLLIATAILETQPEGSHLFLPRRISLSFLLRSVLLGPTLLLEPIAGLIWVKIAKALCK